MKPLISVSIITQSEKMEAILARIHTIPASDSSVLLIGQTGVRQILDSIPDGGPAACYSMYGRDTGGDSLT